MTERLTPEQLKTRLSDLCDLLAMMKRFDGRDHLRTVAKDLADAELDLGPDAEPMGLLRQYFLRGGTKQALTAAIQSDQFLTLQAQHCKGQDQ